MHKLISSDDWKPSFRHARHPQLRCLGSSDRSSMEPAYVSSARSYWCQPRRHIDAAAGNDTRRMVKFEFRDSDVCYDRGLEDEASTNRQVTGPPSRELEESIGWRGAEQRVYAFE